MVISAEGNGIRIDLDEPGWATTYSDWMRKPAVWFLMRKEDDRPMLSVWVHPGEQPYYTARHVGIALATTNSEIVAYGIGKKCLDGSMVRLWLMPGDFICGGEDVAEFGSQLARALVPR